VKEVEDSELGLDRSPSLIAYPIEGMAPMRLVPAASGRAWMSSTEYGFANRCLPLLLANQAGWWLQLDRQIEVTWSGGPAQTSLQIASSSRPPCSASSVFGHGVLTFHVPFLFRTPPGWNLLVRGPANQPKDGVTPLEGVVESDWSVATFTMNWQLTRPGHKIRFERDDPVCMIVPQRRGELESFRPRIAPLASDPETQHAYLEWAESRDLFLLYRRLTRSRPGSHKWQRHYYRGTSPSGLSAREHQSKLHLRPFVLDTDDSGKTPRP
jgi:hypothetical protein